MWYIIVCIFEFFDSKVCNGLDIVINEFVGNFVISVLIFLFVLFLVYVGMFNCVKLSYGLFIYCYSSLGEMNLKINRLCFCNKFI